MELYQEKRFLNKNLNIEYRMGDNNDYDYDNDENENENNNNNNNNNNNQYGGRHRRRHRGSRRSRKNTTMEGGAKIPAVGSTAQVWHGTVRHTSGGLTKSDLMKTKKGRIVSRKKHHAGKKALKNLIKAGFKAKKGTFKLFK